MGIVTKIQSELEGVHYSILQEYLETGNKKLIENDDMLLYLEQLDKVRGWHYSLQTENKIINALRLDYQNLSHREAKSRYADTINYFYGENTIKKEAYRNMVADQMELLAKAATLSAKENKDYKIASDIYKSSIEVRGSMEKDPEKLPDHIYENKTQIFVLDPTLLGLPKADRNVLAEQIDSFAVTELIKKKLKGEASIGSIEIFPEEDA